jgi:hypothetical protein
MAVQIRSDIFVINTVHKKRQFAKVREISLAALLLFLLDGCSSYPQKVFLSVPHKTQTADLCVPTSASMVLSFYGEEESPQYLKELAGYRADFEGTYYVDMSAGLQKIGYEWKSKGFVLDHTGFERGIKEIKGDLADGRPVLISTSSPPIGHTMVVTSYDDAARNVCLMDPARSPGMRIMTYEDLEKIRHDDFQHNDRWLLVTWPGNNIIATQDSLRIFG